MAGGGFWTAFQFERENWVWLVRVGYSFGSALCFRGLIAVTTSNQACCWTESSLVGLFDLWSSKVSFELFIINSDSVSLHISFNSQSFVSPLLSYHLLSIPRRNDPASAAFTPALE